MKKNMTLQANGNTNLFVENLVSAMEESVQGIANIYSSLLEEKVTSRQTLHLLHAQVAFLAMVLPVGLPIAFHAATVAWFALAIKGCRNAGL